MDPRVYRQWTPPLRKGGRAIPGLGLFVNADPDYAEKAVPIIGEGEKEKPTPKLVVPGAAPKPTAKILSPGEPQKPSGKLVVPGAATPKAEAGLVSPHGRPVSAPPPSPAFQGSLPKPRPSAPPPKLGGGLVTPGPQPRPEAKLITPGAAAPKTSGSLARTPYDKPMQPDKPLVDPSGRPISSRLTEGPGAAKPTPKLVVPGAETPKTSGSLVAPSGVVGGRGKQQTAGVETLQEAATKKEAAKRQHAEQVEQQFMDAGPPSQPSTPAVSTQGKEGKGKEGKERPSRARILGPNWTGGLTAGSIYSNLNAPFSALAMDVAGGLQGLTGRGTRREQARDLRTATAQRHELVRQGDAAARAAQLRRSLIPREDTVQVRSGKRLFINVR